ncbi:MAG: twin-arginine translocation signal domain-containing protein [Trueperaceae bacterium]
MSNDRRTFLKRLAAAGLAAPFLLNSGSAQMQHGHGHDGGMPGAPGLADVAASQATATGPDVLAPHAIPWEDGQCAFCGMTLSTPPDMPMPAGFREKTYAQLRLADGTTVNDASTLHYESLACLFNHAYVEGLRDGHGTTFYVADLSEPPAGEGDLLLARDASYVWAENLRVSMNARIGALPDDDALHAFVMGDPELGRHQRYDATQLADLAPLPSGNLIALLARHSGLLEG